MTLDILVVGGGMIVHDEILPSLNQLQRLGRVGAATVCASTWETTARLSAKAEIRRASPGSW